jgi:Flp pilus assembly protein TadG
MKRHQNTNERRGAVAVEAAVALTLLVILLLGLWEVGRLVHVNQIINNAAREGARLAAGGYTNGTPVTASMVQQAAKDYMTAAGLPTAAVSGSQVTLICQASPSWTDPSAALPLDKFQVRVVIPAGAAFSSLKWTSLNSITTATQMSTTVTWESLNNSVITVPTSLPF